MKTIITDNKLGTIEITWRKQSRQVTAHYKNGSFSFSVPNRLSLKQLFDIIENMQPKLIALKKRSLPPTLFNNNFKINLPQFSLNIIENNKYKTAHLKRLEKSITLEVNPNIINHENTQKWIEKAILLNLQTIAYHPLQNRTLELAAKTKTTVADIKIGKAKRSWGNCNSKGIITLSIFTYLLPDHLRDFIILHELAHRQEMNHSKKFYSVWEEYVGENFHNYQQEMKSFTTELQCFLIPKVD